MICLRLREILREQNKSLYWLAKESGVSYQTVHALGKGLPVKRLDMEVLERLARALGCEAGELLEMKAD